MRSQDFINTQPHRASGGVAIERRGFSLVLVLVLTSALLFIAVAFADAVLRSLRSSRLAWQGERATHAADAALLSAIASWSHSSALALRVGETDTIPGSPDPTLPSTVVRTRVHARGFTLDGLAISRDGGIRESQRHIWRAVQLDWPLLPADAALNSLGAVALSNNASVLGTDLLPAGWIDECATELRPTQVSAVSAHTVTADASVTITGDAPAVRLLSDSARTQRDSLASMAFAAMLARATHVTSDSVLSLDDISAGSPPCPVWFGDARRTASTNDACTRRWLVVIAQHSGETRLTGFTPAQGVLVVNGDLRFDAGVRFAGVLLVNGRLIISHPDTAMPIELLGTVFVRDQTRIGSEVRGPVLIASSRCATRLALAAAGTPSPRRQHGWTERP